MPLLLGRGDPHLSEYEPYACDHSWTRAAGDYCNGRGEALRVYDCEECGATRAELIPKPPPVWMQFRRQ